MIALRHPLMVRPDDSHDLRLQVAVLKVEPEPRRRAVEARHIHSTYFLE
jgi:hypothetical protein